MNKLNKTATKIFLKLVEGLLAGEGRRIDHARGAFMAVSVDFLIGDRMRPNGARCGSLYAIAHRYEVNGDLVPDPDVEFYVVDGTIEPGQKSVYPTAIDHGPMGYHRYVEFDEAGHPIHFSRRGQADLARFCNLWMKNIAEQQRLHEVLIQM